jgi:hypothetical protein
MLCCASAVPPACSAYQRALKFGDLGAQKLMECLLARPAASAALTKALTKVRHNQLTPALNVKSSKPQRSTLPDAPVYGAHVVDTQWRRFVHAVRCLA